jgi:LysR family glycine cleavage system transcriptional activator
MAEPFPPLTAMRYFEVAARHRSLTRAAAELNVTHSAISHQIKALERWMGVPLFRRLNRSLELTEAGQALLPPLGEAFRQMGEAARRVRSRESAGPLIISALPSFAAKWLLPRLGSFRQAHPEISVRIAAEDRLTDFARDDVDIAIRSGRGHWPGLKVEPLLVEHMYPVCAPRLLDGPSPIRRPEDLLRHPLLGDYEWSQDHWQRWFAAAGLPEARTQRAMDFNYTNLMIQAAIDGLGVALSAGALVEDDIAAGRLVRPFDIFLPTDFGYYLVMPPERADRPKIAAFRRWILAESASATASGGAADGLIGG